MEGKGGDWPNRHITFILAKKLHLQFILLRLQYCGGLVENVIWEEGLAENVRIPSNRKGSKIAQKSFPKSFQKYTLFKASFLQ